MILGPFNLTAAPIVLGPFDLAYKQPTELPTINVVGETLQYVLQGSSFTLPAWTASDDIDPLTVTWEGSVNTATLGTYLLTASASNALGSTIEPLTVIVERVLSSSGIPDFIPRLLKTTVQQATLFAGLGNWLKATITHNGAAVDLTAFTKLELRGLTQEPIDSVSRPDAFVVSAFGEINIDTGMIRERELIKPIGVVKTILIGYSANESEGVVLWHPTLRDSRMSVNIIPV